MSCGGSGLLGVQGDLQLLDAGYLTKSELEESLNAKKISSIDAARTLVKFCKSVKLPPLRDRQRASEQN